MSTDLEQTIVAIASAPGPANRAIVRLSGPDALAICRTIADPSDDLPTKLPTAIRANVVLPGDRNLPVWIWVWPTIRSYTRQPQVEIHLIGSQPLAELVLQKATTVGARLARPGEFTMRAFLAGRLDLTQAEGVLAVIDAENENRLQSALRQLAGGLSQPLQAARHQLIEMLALLEAGLDFVEEDIEFIPTEELMRRLEEIQNLVQSTLRQIGERHVSDRPPRAVLLGPPNAGKSTLFNLLTTSDGSIISKIAGTTRDVITARFSLGGQTIELVDTAGVEDSDEESSLEAIMQRQTQQAAGDADIWIVCAESESGLKLCLRKLPERPVSDRVIQLLTKWEQPTVPPSGGKLGVSAHKNIGIDSLKELLARSMDELEPGSGEISASTANRCAASLAACDGALSNAAEILRMQDSEEIVAAELRLAIGHLAEVVGAVYTDDVLDIIFSRFCIGK